MDMLISLCAMSDCLKPLSAETGAIRKPIGPEHDTITAWVANTFSPGWASEARVALNNRPVSLIIATRGEPSELIGFCCYDATARGFFGPIGVAESARGTGVGAALLRACLADMRAVGYGYAVAGAVGAPEFLGRVAGAVEIPDSSPGICRGMLRG